MTSLTVLETGPLATIQDRGRTGQAALGVPRSGACDLGSYELANRLVGNTPGAAAIETTFGGLVLRASSDVVFAVTGAPCAGVPFNALVDIARWDRVATGDASEWVAVVRGSARRS